MTREEQLDAELIVELKSLLQDHPDAINFACLYNDYIHAVDDVIDENGSYREVLKVTSLAACVFTMPFWRQYGSQLLLVDQLNNNQYADSVEWENSDKQWMLSDSKCLSHAGYNMFFAVIILLKGYDILRKISPRWRERAHLKHLNDGLKTDTFAREVKPVNNSYEINQSTRPV